jgi:hypothetical protein
VGDGGGAFGLADGGGDEPDFQRGIGGAQDGGDHLAALVRFGDDLDGERPLTPLASMRKKR